MRERIRLWILGKLDALPLSTVNAEIAMWQQELQGQIRFADGLRVIIAALEPQLEDARAQLDTSRANFKERDRELRISQREKQQLSDVLDARTNSANAEISEWKEKSEGQASAISGLESIVDSARVELADLHSQVDPLHQELASRIRELRTCQEEKTALDEQLRRRSAAVANTDTRVVKQAAIRVLESLPVLVQEAACYATRKVAQDKSIPGSMGFGKNMKRDEACEWAGHWLREKKEKFKDSDVNMACELYYHLDHKE